jgi:hypothetical protein
MFMHGKLKKKAFTIVPVILSFVLLIGWTQHTDKNSDFIMGQKINYQEFWTDYKKGSGLISGKKYTMYACIDGTVRLPFYKGILSQSYYYGSACYSPEELYISDYDFYGVQKRLEFKNMKGMYWVTVYVDIDGGIVVVDFKK